MLLNVTLIFYFKVKLFIIGKENIPFLGMLWYLACWYRTCRRQSFAIIWKKETTICVHHVIYLEIYNNYQCIWLIDLLVFYANFSSISAISFYFKVKLFIFGKENIPFLGMLWYLACWYRTCRRQSFAIIWTSPLAISFKRNRPCKARKWVQTKRGRTKTFLN
jgi:hypothetical protein